MKKRKRKKSLTLLEIMIVIFLIGIIGSVIAYNMKGSLEEGRAFKTKEGAKRLRDLILLEMAKRDLHHISDPIELIQEANVVADVRQLLSDGWGQAYQINYDDSQGEVQIYSPGYIQYMTKHKKAHDIPYWMKQES